MTDEERLHMITEQLIIVRDNLFRGMSKSIQKLQARSINEVLGLENFIESPKREWVGLTDEEIAQTVGSPIDEVYLVDFRRVIAKLKERNT
jgi:hypothetical protein